jgi:hypothetical protein
MTNHDNSNYGKAGGSSGRCITMAAHGNKHLVRSPTYHFRRLLEVACPDHVYPIRHKLEDYDMMKSFMISGSFTQGIELNEDSGGSNTIPFPEEDSHDGLWWWPPTREASHVQTMLQAPNSLWLGTLGHMGVRAQIFLCPYIYTYIYIFMNM